jgi:general secretion pathway protein G
MIGRGTSRAGGFTLLEVLLVLAILGVITAMVVPRLIGRQKHANIDATKLSIKGLEHALKLYALDHDGEYPGTRQGLDSLMTAPDSKDTRWKGPYLENPARDAWGRPFQYEYPGRHRTTGFDIFSSGPDGVPGTDDDISNWTAES